MAHDVFISYSARDKTVANAVCFALESRKIRCWIAPRDVPPGATWARALVEAIRKSCVFVLVFSDGSNKSPQVIREVGEAVDSGIPVIPFRIEDVQPSTELGYYIKAVHWLDALTPPLEEHLQRLADTVQTLLVAKPPEQPPVRTPAMVERERAPQEGVGLAEQPLVTPRLSSEVRTPSAQVKPRRLDLRRLATIGGGAVIIIILGFFALQPSSPIRAVLGWLPSAPAETPTPTPMLTPMPTTTSTRVPPTPTPTPLPGKETIPLSNLAPSIPWLPLDESRTPSIEFYYFNVTRPPFDNPLVRQAFALAVNRETIVDIATNMGAIDPRPATNLTPPDTLGRDLYGYVGLPFDPGRARELLANAGYPNGYGFPQVTLVFNIGTGINQAIADAMVVMWRDNLGINVGLESVDTMSAYLERLGADAPGIFRMGWTADYNDPDNFLNTLFHSGAEYNYGKLANTEFDRLVEQAAAAASDPATRQKLCIQAERILCEQEAALIPLYHFYAPIQ